MKLVTFAHLNAASTDSPLPGALVGNQIVDLSALGFRDMLGFLRGGETALTSAADAVANGSRRIPLDSVRLLAPLQCPPRIFCVGLNYRDHAIESKMEIPKVPTIFLKLPSAIIGPNANIELPPLSKQPDFEAELAIVIGTGGSNIAREDWQQHVAGYTILNDVSARDVQLSTTQWTLGKSFNTFAPLGPAIVTKDEFANLELDIKLEIDGELLQHSNTRELIFKVPELIAYISSITPLEPGDIISTGTPAGVGLGRTPQRWLKSGETITIEISGIGKLTNPVV